MPPTCARCCPGPSSTSRPRWRRCGRSATQVRSGGAAALRDLSERFDGVRPTDLRVPARGAGRRAGRSRPGGPGRARGVDPAGPAGPPRPAPHRRHHAGRARRHGHRALGAGRPGRALRARRARGLPEQRRDERRPGPGGRASGSLAVASPPQRDNPTEFAGLPHPTILAACALLGVEEVYAVGGAQAIAMFAYGARETDGPDAGELLCAPVDLVTGPGNVYVAAAKRAAQGPDRHRRRGRADRDRDPRRRLRVAGARRRRPGQPGRARPAGRGGAGHRQRGAGGRRSRSSWSGRSPRPSTSSGSATALSGRQSGVVLVDDLDVGLVVVDAYAAEHLEIQTRDARERAGAVRNAGAIFVGAVRAGLARGLLRRLQPRAADRRLRPALQRAVRAGLPARDPRRGLRRGRAARRRRARHRAGRRRGPARARRRRPGALRPALSARTGPAASAP